MFETRVDEHDFVCALGSETSKTALKGIKQSSRFTYIHSSELMLRTLYDECISIYTLLTRSILLDI